MAQHPMQPVVMVGKVARFKQNKIVDYILDELTRRGIGLNELTCMNFSREDWNQFAQLIGYSVSGFGDLSYAYPKIVKIADAEVEKLLKQKEVKNARRSRTKTREICNK